MFSMPPCKSHWKANGSEPGGEQANENPARNGIHAFFSFMFFDLAKFRTAVDCINLL